MEIKEAIAYLRPIADSASLPNYAAALEVAIQCMKDVRSLRIELRDERDRFDRLIDFELAEARVMQSLRAKAGWISVEDRLPDEKSGKVLMTDGKSHYLAPREWMHRVNGADGIYIPANHGAGAKITHWMPLPEPPEVD